MKKILALILTLALIATVGITSAFAADDGFVDGKFTETRHITVEIFDRQNDGGTDPTNNVWTDYIKKQMLDLYNVEVEYVAILRNGEDKLIGPALADGTAPGICYTYNNGAIESYAAMLDADGNPGIIDLAPLVEEYKDYLADFIAMEGGIEALYTSQDPLTGNLWYFEGMRAEIARITTFIRKDWLDTLGLDLPTNEEQFHDCLVAFRDNAEKLLGEDADKMIPYSTSTDVGWRNDLLCASKVADSISDETMFVYGFDDRHMLYPGYSEGLRVLNNWYNEGLIWKDFALHNGDTAEDDNMKAGYVGAFQHNWDYPFRGEQESINANLMRKYGENAMFVPVDCFQNDAGVTRKYLGAAIGSDRKIFMPSTNKEPLASLLYINFISKPEVIKYMQLGDEGNTYKLHDNGACEIINVTCDWVRNSGKNIDYTITCNGLYVGEATPISLSLQYADGTPSEVVAQAYEYGQNNGRFPKKYSVGTIEEENDLGATLNSMRDEVMTKSVVAPEGTFDAVYADMMDSYLNAGGQDIIDARIAKLAEVYNITYEK